jgi:hypothetical protein
MAHAEGDMFSFIVMSRNREDSCDNMGRDGCFTDANDCAFFIELSFWR